MTVHEEEGTIVGYDAEFRGKVTIEFTNMRL